MTSGKFTRKRDEKERRIDLNKEDYLRELEASLKKHLSKPEVEEILRDYGEYFEDGRRQNKSDTEIAAKLGTPELIARQFIEETQNDPKEKHGEELALIREKTVQGLQAVQKNLDTVRSFHPLKRLLQGISFVLHMVGRGLCRIGTGIGTLFKKGIPVLGKGLRILFRFLAAVARRGLLLGWTLLLGISLLTTLTVLAFLTVAFLLVGLAGLFAAIVTMSLISPYFTAAGFFCALFGLSVAALFAVGAYCLLRRSWRCVRQYDWKNQTTAKGEIVCD